MIILSYITFVKLPMKVVFYGDVNYFIDHFSNIKKWLDQELCQTKS